MSSKAASKMTSKMASRMSSRKGSMNDSEAPNKPGRVMQQINNPNERDGVEVENDPGLFAAE